METVSKFKSEKVAVHPMETQLLPALIKCQQHRRLVQDPLMDLHHKLHPNLPRIQRHMRQLLVHLQPNHQLFRNLDLIQ